MAQELFPGVRLPSGDTATQAELDAVEAKADQGIADAAAAQATADAAVVNGGTVPMILEGAATDLDANGNPAPDAASFPPANYPEGARFIATSFPAAVDAGDMQFVLRAGVWVWESGSYRSSNSNGDYVRSADRGQECWQAGLTLTQSNTDFLAVTWTLPAAFADSTFFANFAPQNIGDVSESQNMQRTDNHSTTGVRFSLVTPNLWEAGDTVNARGYARGAW